MVFVGEKSAQHAQPGKMQRAGSDELENYRKLSRQSRWVSLVPACARRGRNGVPRNTTVPRETDVPSSAPVPSPAAPNHQFDGLGDNSKRRVGRTAMGRCDQSSVSRLCAVKCTESVQDTGTVIVRGEMRGAGASAVALQGAHGVAAAACWAGEGRPHFGARPKARTFQ